VWFDRFLLQTNKTIFGLGLRFTLDHLTGIYFD